MLLLAWLTTTPTHVVGLDLNLFLREAFLAMPNLGLGLAPLCWAPTGLCTPRTTISFWHISPGTKGGSDSLLCPQHLPRHILYVTHEPYDLCALVFYSVPDTVYRRVESGVKSAPKNRHTSADVGVDSFWLGLELRLAFVFSACQPGIPQ